MDEGNPKKSGLSGGVARVLNAGGSALVSVYDLSSSAIGGLVSLVKKAPGLPRKATGMFTGGLGTIRPSEARNMEAKIKDYESKIQALYYEIGKEGAKYPEAEHPLEVESVKKLIADVREYEKEIQRLKDRVVEIETQRKEAERERKKHGKEAGKIEEKTSYEQINKALGSAIQQSLRHGVFETTSERAIFDKVAHDLLDSEMEIKVLAAAELGKMGNEAAVPVLCEAAKFNEPSLTSEVINSLINIGDSRAIPLFKAKVNDPKYRVRVGCLRGLYKLAGDDEAMPFLVDALRDAHPEVRRTAATFIGWKDYADATPALIQSLRDEDERVRKAAISSLANIKDESSVLPLIKLLGDSDPEVREKALDAVKTITGEDLSFDIHASGKALAESIEALRDWWQKERLGKADMAEAEEAVAAYSEAEDAEVAPVEEEAPTAETAGLEAYAQEVEEREVAEAAEYEAEAEAVEEAEETGEDEEETAAETEGSGESAAAPDKEESFSQ